MNNYNIIIMVEYKSPLLLCSAAKLIKQAGYENWDTYTPFPVHGLDKAMGLKPSPLPWFVLIAAIFGLVSISCLMIWVSVYAYPLNIGGKPTWSIPAFVPPAFEVTVLFSALTAVFGMFFLCGLPRHNHYLFNSSKFEKVTNDGFFLVIELVDCESSLNQTKILLEKTHPMYIEVMREVL